jgi:hypothetical protein
MLSSWHIKCACTSWWWSQVAPVSVKLSFQQGQLLLPLLLALHLLLQLLTLLLPQLLLTLLLLLLLLLLLCTLAAQGEAEERLVARANPGLGNPYEKKKLLQDIRSAKNVTEADETLGGKEFSTSTKFFGALQQSVKDTIKEQAGGAAVVSKKALKEGNAAAALRL